MGVKHLRAQSISRSDFHGIRVHFHAGVTCICKHFSKHVAFGSRVTDATIMECSFVDRILGLTPLRRYLQWAPLLEETKDALVSACHDRAVLLPELHDVVLTFHLGLSGPELVEVKGISQAILDELPLEVDTPGKYLPCVAHRGGKDITSG